MAGSGTASDRVPSTWLLPVVIGVGYLALAQAIRFLAPPDFQGPVFWPAAGLALGVLLITEGRRWPLILLAVAIGETTSNLLMDIAFLPSLGWALANVAHPLLAAWTIRQLHPRFALTSLPQLGAFVVLGGLVGPLLSATIGTATGVLADGRAWTGLVRWWVGDGLGALVIAPLFIAWQRRSARRVSLELTITLLALLGVCLLVFRNWEGALDPVLPYLVIPPLVWCALRFEVPGAAVGIAIVGLVGGWSTWVGFGPFAVPTGSAQVLFEVFLLIVVATALLVGVLRTNLVEREELYDAAERRRQAVEQLNQELGRAVRARDQLVSMVSHELRGPLTPILGFAAALERSAADGGLDDEQRASVAAIQRNAGRMVSLIDELLISARVAAGELTATPQPIDVVTEVRRTLQEELGAHDIDLVADGTSSPVALVERGHFNQMLANLVTNARKYGQPPIEVRIRDVDDRVEVEVADHGPGVATDVRPVMFERFTQAEGPPTHDPGAGVGLGLAIVKMLAEANHGEITYRPPEAGGPSRFVLSFPTASP
jgi:signal transduction histidine kinase